MQRHAESSAWIPAAPQQVFDRLDDQRALSAHMSRRSWMTLGSTFRIDLDQWEGRRVGSVMRLSGRIVGVSLRLDEIVTQYEPGGRKEWATLGEPRLLVIGPYRMGFDLRSEEAGSRLTVWIDYHLPSGFFTRILGRMLGPMYARWCVRKMAEDAKKTA